jgi:hypothetical protein
MEPCLDLPSSAPVDAPTWDRYGPGALQAVAEEQDRAVAIGAAGGLSAMKAGETLAATAVGDEIVSGDVSGGPSTSQTIMVSSLRRLLSELPRDAAQSAYRSAVMDENVLGKATTGGREWAFRQLRRYYTLDPQSLLFRALRDLWELDPDGQPLLALLCALARDPVLRATASVIVGSAPGETITTSDFQAAIESKFPATYKENTLRTSAQNVASSWDQAGYLHQQRRRSKVRTRAHATTASIAYALMLGYLQGGRGQALFDTLWVRVLDQVPSHLLDLAAAASQQGMLEFRQAGGVIEVAFRQLLRPFDNRDQGRLL